MMLVVVCVRIEGEAGDECGDAREVKSHCRMIKPVPQERLIIYHGANGGNEIFVFAEESASLVSVLRAGPWMKILPFHFVLSFHGVRKCRPSCCLVPEHITWKELNHG